jgi:hypothetical protein
MTAVEMELMIIYMRGEKHLLTVEQRERARTLIIETPIEEYSKVYWLVFKRVFRE